MSTKIYNAWKTSESLSNILGLAKELRESIKEKAITH